MKLDDITLKQVMISMACGLVVLLVIVVAQGFIIQNLIVSTNHLMEDSIASQITIVDKTWTCSDFQDYKKMMDQLGPQDPKYISSTLDKHIISQGKLEGCI